jgi:pyruvate/2-oxoglutarate dehydrogenase complex dihydrolipoamide dehydrogenase (E3) component
MWTRAYIRSRSRHHHRGYRQQARVPPIKGIDGKNIYIADDVLNGQEVKGSHIAVLGAGLVGAETAEYLAERGKTVEIFDFIEDIAPTFNKARRWFLLKRNNDHGIKTHMNTKIVENALPAITFETAGKTETIGGFDAMVVAAGRKTNDELAKVIRNEFPEIELHVVGDAVKADTAIEAITDAALTAASLQ